MVRNFDTDLLITEIKKRRSIWDTSYVDHANKDVRRKNWDEVIHIFGGDNISASERHVLGFTLRRRWKSLRACFARELKRKKNYGAGMGRKSEYKYYKQLLFLTNVMNIIEKDEDGLEPQYIYLDDSDLDINQPILKENNCKCKQLDEEPYSDREDDEDRLFLLSLHKTLKRIPKNKKMAVQIKMLSVLNKALFDEGKIV